MEPTYDADTAAKDRQAEHEKEERKAAKMRGEQVRHRKHFRLLGDFSYYKAAQGEYSCFTLKPRELQAGEKTPSQHLPFVKTAKGWEQVSHERMRKAWSVVLIYRLQQEGLRADEEEKEDVPPSAAVLTSISDV